MNKIRRHIKMSFGRFASRFYKQFSMFANNEDLFFKLKQEEKKIEEGFYKAIQAK
jgi:hypothetical protein